MKIRPFTDKEWDELPHVVLTSDCEWDPSFADYDACDDQDFLDGIPDLPNGFKFDEIDQCGVFICNEVCVNFHETDTEPIKDELEVNEVETTPSEVDYNEYSKYFLNKSAEVIKKTFECTTQYARSGFVNAAGRIYNTYKSPFPAMNVRRRNEAVATDTIFSDTPAINGGATKAQFFHGLDSKYRSIHPLKNDNQFRKALMEEIRTRGAMDKLVSDGAKEETSEKVLEVLRYLCIDSWQSEPHYQHQNPAERSYQDAKTSVNIIMNMVGAPAYTWLLCFCYVLFILNRLAHKSLDWTTPYEKLHGVPPDISMIYRFKFWDPVYVSRVEDITGKCFPSQTDEISGRFVGFSEDVGHPMTFKILTDDTQQVISRSRVRKAEDCPNKRLESPKEGEFQDFVFSKDRPMAVLDPDSLIGRTYVSDPDDDDVQVRLKIVEAIENQDKSLANDPLHMKFRAINSEETLEEILSYNEILDKLESEDGEDSIWKFKSLDAHQGPLKPGDPSYKGSRWNVRVRWESGETTYKPLSVIAKTDPVTCAIYAKENNLLELEGWKQFARLARRHKKMLRLANQAKLQSFRNRPVYKFGVQIPRSHEEAMLFDKQNGNDNWLQAEKRELAQINEYKTFKDLGKDGKPPKGYKKIRVHMVYDFKHDGRYKARLVAGGHLTEVPIHSVYSSVVTLRGLRIAVFLGELNQLEVWGTDIGNAYLEAFMEELLYIIAGPEFGELEGHVLIILKALYGLRSSGLRWWERFSVVLQKMGFFPSKAEDDIWMRRKGDHYEYIARYVDDLAIVSKDPAAIIKCLEEVHNFKLKGSGKLDYHLGCNFFRDDDGVLCMGPKKYIERMIDNYVRMFGCKPKQNVSSPLEKGDHPELDCTAELDDDGIKKYQSLIGALQWAVSIGRFDIATAVMTLSKFRTAPKEGHLDRVKRIFG